MNVASQSICVNHELWINKHDLNINKRVFNGQFRQGRWGSCSRMLRFFHACAMKLTLEFNSCQKCCPKFQHAVTAWSFHAWSCSSDLGQIQSYVDWSWTEEEKEALHWQNLLPLFLKKTLALCFTKETNTALFKKTEVVHIYSEYEKAWVGP